MKADDTHVSGAPHEAPATEAVLDSLLEHVLHLDSGMRILWANTAACASAGMSREDLRGRRCHEIWAGSPLPCGDCPVVRAIRTGQPHDVEKTTPDGRAWYIRGYPLRDEAGRIRGGVEITLEITQRRQAELALSEKEERLRLALEAANEGLWDLDPRTREVFYSPRWFTMLGYEPDAFPQVYETWRELLHPEDRAITEERVWDHIQRCESFNLVFRMRAAGGDYRWIMAKGDVMSCHTGGNARRLVGTHVDITDLKHAQEERQALVHELEEKNAELERFLYAASHDLKTPLVTIEGFLGLLENDLDAGDPARRREDMRIIHEAAERMKRLLDEVIELSRAGQVIDPRAGVSLREVATAAVAQVAGPLRERGVAVSIAPDLPVAFCDRMRLLEVFQNLVENAVKYMGDQADPRIEIGVRAGAGGPVITVRDNGIGIEPRYHQKIFDLFDQLDPSQEGTGLGLALVKRIVTVHGGGVWVESEGLGRGATFCFTLGAPPAAPDAPGGEEPGGAGTGPPASP
jgi:PAS domain S-box-containing protein